MDAGSMMVGTGLFLAGFTLGVFVGGKLGEMEQKLKQADAMLAQRAKEPT